MTRAEYEDIALGFTWGWLAFPVIGWWAGVSAGFSAYFWWRAGRVGSS